VASGKHQGRSGVAGGEAVKGLRFGFNL
jgi:hypothetical protein